MLTNWKNEKGSISVLLAFFLVAILLFVGFAVDVGMLYYKQLRLKEVGNIIRNARLDEETILQSSSQPSADLTKLAQNYAEKNGLRDDQVSAQFKDTQYSYTDRKYELDIKLTDTYQYTTLRLLGYKQQNIEVNIHGYGHFYYYNGVWKPSSD